MFGSAAVCFKRLYYLNDQPYIYFVHYLPKDMNKMKQKEFDKESLYRLLTQNNHIIDSFQMTFLPRF